MSEKEGKKKERGGSKREGGGTARQGVNQTKLEKNIRGVELPGAVLGGADLPPAWPSSSPMMRSGTPARDVCLPWARRPVGGANLWGVSLEVWHVVVSNPAGFKGIFFDFFKKNKTGDG